MNTIYDGEIGKIIKLFSLFIADEQDVAKY